MKSEIYSQSKYILYVGLKNFVVGAGQTYFWLDTTHFWWDRSRLLSLAQAGEPLLHVFGPPSLA